MKKIIILVIGAAIGALLFQWVSESKDQTATEDSEDI